MKTSIGVFLVFSLILMGSVNVQAQPVTNQQKLEALHKQIQALRLQLDQEKESVKLSQMKQKLHQLQREMRQTFGSIIDSEALEPGNQFMGQDIKGLGSNNGSQAMGAAVQ